MMILPWGFSLWLAWAFVISLLLITKLSLKRIIIALYSFLWMVILTVLAHGFTTPGVILFEIKSFDLIFTQEGLFKGCILSARFLSVILLALILSHKISATEGVMALESFLSPLKRIGIPTGQFVLMINMSLRFIPILYEEALTIRKSLMVRGWKKKGNILKSVGIWVPLFIPVLASGLRRSDDIAESLILRGYDPSSQFNYFEKTRLGFLDYSVYLIAISPGLTLLLSNYYAGTL